MKLDLEELRNIHVMICVPCYGGQEVAAHGKSNTMLEGLFTKYGLKITWNHLYNESLVQRARNCLVDNFLRSNCTHLLFIDADIVYTPKDVLALITANLDVVGATYPMKQLNWARVKEVVLANPEIDPEELQLYTGNFAFNMAEGTHKFDLSQPLEVTQAPTGFLLIKREVFAKYKAAYPEFAYQSNQSIHPDNHEMFAYFETGIVDNKYLSEDYYFSEMYRRIGGKIFILPSIELMHVGTYFFTGSFQRCAAFRAANSLQSQ